MSGDDDAPAEPVVEDIEEPTLEEQLAAALEASEAAKKEISYRDAEIANIRKRHAQDRSDIIRYGSQGLARRLIPLLDDFDRAISVMPEGSDDSIVEGVKMTRSSLEAALTTEGARAIDAVGQPFDPNTMEAITTIPPSDEHPAGMVVEVLENGWMLHDRVLRPARVIVTAVE